MLAYSAVVCYASVSKAYARVNAVDMMQISALVRFSGCRNARILAHDASCSTESFFRVCPFMILTRFRSFLDRLKKKLSQQAAASVCACEVQKKVACTAQSCADTLVFFES